MGRVIEKFEILNDDNISLKAKGVFFTISNIERTNLNRVNIIELTKICKDGKGSVTSALKELIEHGYVKRKHVVGKYIEYIILKY